MEEDGGTVTNGWTANMQQGSSMVGRYPSDTHQYILYWDKAMIFFHDQHDTDTDTGFTMELTHIAHLNQLSIRTKNAFSQTSFNVIA